MRYIVIGIIVLMLCVLIAILDDILNIIGLRKRIKEWFRNFKGVING